MRVVKLRLWRISFSTAVAIFLIALFSLFLTPRPSFEPTYAVSRPLPMQYWRHMYAHPERYSNRACAAFPRISDLYFETAFWQKVKSHDGNMYVYGAYWDHRFEEPVVRVLLYSEVAPLPRLYCQLWYLNDGRPYTVAGNATYAWVSEWAGPVNGISEPYILTCPTRPKGNTVWAADDARQLPPQAVSVVSSLCQPATNALAIQGAPKLSKEPLADGLTLEHPRYERPNNMSIGVCLASLDSQDDISGQLAEWLQFAKTFGADTVYVYLTNVHPNVRLVLDHYRHIGLADVTDILAPPRSYFTPAGFQSSFGEVDKMMLHWRRQMLPANDCLYRAIHRHQWITYLNLNEIVVPVRDSTWSLLIDEEGHETFDVLAVDRYFFAKRAGNKVVDIVVEKRKYNETDDSITTVKKYLPRMLVQTWVMPTPAKRGTYESSFVRTSKILSMRNHLPLACYGSCRTRYVEPATAKLHIYSSSDMEMCALLELASDVVCRANLAALYSDEALSHWNYVAKDVENLINKLHINSYFFFYYHASHITNTISVLLNLLN